MPRPIDSNQQIKIDRPYLQPIYLVHLFLRYTTVYFSDRNFNYNGHNYEDYLFDLSNIGNEIRNLGGYDNSKLTLRFKSDKILSYNTLIEFFDAFPPEKKYVEIYKLCIDTGETFGSDVSTKIFKGEMGQPYDIGDPSVDFKIDCSLMLFGKNVSLPLDVIDLADFPSADPDDVGKYRNIPYGSIKKLVCPWTVAGWLSNLTADITDVATSIDVSDAANSPATPFTTLCESEEIRITNKSGNTFTVTRGYNGTDNVAHNKGGVIYEKRSDFEAEVSQYPVKAIGDVYIRQGESEWLRVISGVTKNINTGGRATLVFTDKPKYEEKTNLSVSTGSHPHLASMSGNTIKKCIPTGATGGTYPWNAIDGNEESWASLSSGQVLNVTFTEYDLGPIAKEYIWVFASGGTMTIRCPDSTSLGDFTFSTPGWKRIPKAYGTAWGDDISIVGPATGCQVFEVYKEVEYLPDVTVEPHAADGVALIGNSSVNMVIGDLAACDVDGIPDDASGTYTGTPDICPLIERPDHVRKHILMGLLGFVAGDIGSSFATVGTIYAGRISGGYKFGFNLPEVATQTMDLFEAMDLQSRSNMFESGGLFQLAFGSTEDPTSQKTFDKDNIRGSFLFGKTEVADIRNKIVGHLFRDYSKSGNLGDIYQKVMKKESSQSIAKYGENQMKIEFNCIDDQSDMVNDVLDWIILEKKEFKKIVKFDAFWDAITLESCDYFTVLSNFWSGNKYKTISMIEDSERQIIKMEGLEFKTGNELFVVFRGVPGSSIVEGLGFLEYIYAAVSGSGVYRYDGAGGWTNVGIPGSKSPFTLLVFENSLYCGTYGTVAGDARVYKLVDGSWSQIGANLETNKGVYSMVVFGNTIYVGTWPSGKVYRLDAGPVWTSVGQLGSSTSILSLVDFNGTLYGASSNGNVFRYDGGTTWTQVGTEVANRLAVNNGQLYGAYYYPGWENQIFKYNSGTSWDLIGEFPGSSRAEICSFYDEVYVAISLPGYISNVYKYTGTPLSWNLCNTFSQSAVIYSLATLDGAIWIGLGDGRVFSYS